MKLPIALPKPGSAAVDFAAVGECSLDYVGMVSAWPGPDEKHALRSLSVQPGGQAATAALAGRLLGWTTRFCGAVGDDEAAAMAVEPLRRAGVDVRVATRSGTRTRTAMVLVDPSGSRTVMGYRDPASFFTAGDVDAALAADARLVLVDATSLPASVAVAREARRRGRPVLVDVDGPQPGLDELLAEVDVLVVSAAALSALTGRSDVDTGLSGLAASSPAAVVIVTLGAEGSLAFSQGQAIRTRAPQVAVTDTTGAGDAFRGGLAAGWLREGAEADLGRVLTYANTVAALSCRSIGAQAGLPTADEVARFL